MLAHGVEAGVSQEGIEILLSASEPGRATVQYRPDLAELQRRLRHNR